MLILIENISLNEKIQKQKYVQQKYRVIIKTYFDILNPKL